MSTPHRLRRASALIPWRRGEVYLARRLEHRPFFGNFFAFVGGGLDGVDDAVAASASVARSAFDSALVREAVEELGVHLHLREEARPLSPAERETLLADGHSWSVLHPRFDLQAIDPPCCRLVTPDFYPLRFDTCFYLMDLDRAAPGATLDPTPTELAEGRWATPARWLDSWGRGDVLLVPPALILLRALADLTSAEGDDLGPARESLAAASRRLEKDPLQPIYNEPLARLLPLRTPTLPPARHTNAYLVGRDPAYLVDPASPHPEVQRELGRVLDDEAAQGLRLEAVVLTHHHSDHVGAAEFVRRRFGVPVWAHAETARRLRGVVAVDRTIEDQEALDLGRSPGFAGPWRLRAVHTPGHAPGHLCFLDDRYRTLVAGDMVSTLSSILIDPEDGDLGQYESSLQRLIDLQPRVVLPAHGPADGRGATILREQLDHRRRRTQQVRDAIEGGARECREIADAIYGGVPTDQRAYAGRSVTSILRRLAELGETELDAPEQVKRRL